MNDVWQKIFTELDTLVLVSISSPHNKKQQIQRVRIKPILLKKERHFQIEEFSKTQCFTKNILPHELEKALDGYQKGFSLAVFRFEEKEMHLTISETGEISSKTKLVQAKAELSHNRVKNYPIPEDEPVDFLIHLGIQNKEGRVLREKHDKFKQINQFIQILKPVFEKFDKTKPFCIVDLACGKAYLTFAIYYYLTKTYEVPVTLYGVDLKSDVLQKCQKLANDLGYSGMHFVSKSIADFHLEGTRVDLVVALHACDTATDAAILKALSLHASAIAVAPCCQHEVAKQLKKESAPLILRHGLLKERYAALVTDALRAEFLEQKGYLVDLVEFVDPEHTPKNLLIRAVKKTQNKEADFTGFQSLAKSLGIHKFSLD